MTLATLSCRMGTIKKGSLLALTVAVGLSICSPARAQWPTYRVEQPFEWAEATPREQGVSPRLMRKAFKRGSKLRYLRALLVVKNGHLIGERYYRSNEITDANTVMSVSKSFLSALAGIAIRRGHVSLDQRVMDFFPEYSGPDLDPRKGAITVRHLLTMTSGLPFDDHAEHWNGWMSSADWVGFCLQLPLVSDPGATWNYSTCSTHILSAFLTRATGMSTYDFAREFLFEPMGISIGGWRRDPQGYYRGGWDMYFTPRDMARFGFLFMNMGSLDNTRILSRSWVRKSTRPYVSGWTWADLGILGYGFWWWTADWQETYKLYFALGYAGQFIVVVPALELIIVAATDANCDWDEAGEQGAAVRDLITESLLEPMTR